MPGLIRRIFALIAQRSAASLRRVSRPSAFGRSVSKRGKDAEGRPGGTDGTKVSLRPICPIAPKAASWSRGASAFSGEALAMLHDVVGCPSAFLRSVRVVPEGAGHSSTPSKHPSRALRSRCPTFRLAGRIAARRGRAAEPSPTGRSGDRRAASDLSEGETAMDEGRRAFIHGADRGRNFAPLRGWIAARVRQDLAPMRRHLGFCRCDAIVLAMRLRSGDRLLG